MHDEEDVVHDVLDRSVADPEATNDTPHERGVPSIDLGEGERGSVIVPWRPPGRLGRWRLHVRF